jgi:hypothetical protein
MDIVWYQYPLLFLVSGVAGAINSVAGGGTPPRRNSPLSVSPTCGL